MDVRGVLLHGRVKRASHSNRDLHRLLVNASPRAIRVVEAAGRAAPVEAAKASARQARLSTTSPLLLLSLLLATLP